MSPGARVTTGRETPPGVSGWASPRPLAPATTSIPALRGGNILSRAHATTLVHKSPRLKSREKKTLRDAPNAVRC